MAKTNILTGSSAADNRNAILQGNFGKTDETLGQLVIDNTGWRWTKSNISDKRNYKVETVTANIKTNLNEYDIENDKLVFKVSNDEFNTINTKVAQVSISNLSKPCFISINGTIASAWKNANVTVTGKNYTLYGKITEEDNCTIYGLSNIISLTINRVYLSKFVELLDTVSSKYELQLKSLTLENVLLNKGESITELSKHILSSKIASSLTELYINSKNYFEGNFLPTVKEGKNNEYLDTFGDNQCVSFADDDNDTFIKSSTGITLRCNDFKNIIFGTFADAVSASSADSWGGDNKKIDGYDLDDLPIINLQNSGKWFELKVPSNMKVTQIDIWGIPNKNKATGAGSWFSFNTDNTTVVKVDDVTGATSSVTIKTIDLYSKGEDDDGVTSEPRNLKATVQMCSTEKNKWTHYRATVLNPNAAIKIMCGDGTDAIVKNSKLTGFSNKKVWAHISITGSTIEPIEQVNCNNKTSITTRVSELSGLDKSPTGDGFVAVSDSKGVFAVSPLGETTAIYEASGDREAITVDSNKDIYVLKEGVQSLVKLAAPNYSSEEVVSSAHSADLLALADDPEGHGFEGLAWKTGDTFFIGNQKDPAVIVEYSISKGIQKKHVVNFTSEIADLHFDSSANELYILESTTGYVYKMSVNSDDYGKLLKAWKTDINGELENPEALYVDLTNKIFYIGCDKTSKIYKVKMDFDPNYQYDDYFTDADVEEQNKKIEQWKTETLTYKLICEIPTADTLIDKEVSSDGKVRYFAKDPTSGIAVQCIATNWDSWSDELPTSYVSLSNFINNVAFPEYNNEYTLSSKEKVAFSDLRILLDNEDYSKRKSGEFEMRIPKSAGINYFTLTGAGHNGIKEGDASRTYIDYQIGNETYSYLTSHILNPDNDFDNISYLTCYLRNATTTTFKYTNGEVWQDEVSYAITEEIAKKAWVNLKFYKNINGAVNPTLPAPVTRKQIVDDLVPLNYTNLKILGEYDTDIVGLSGLTMNAANDGLYAVSDKYGLFSLSFEGITTQLYDSWDTTSTQSNKGNIDAEGITLGYDGAIYACSEAQHLVRFATEEDTEIYAYENGIDFSYIHESIKELHPDLNYSYVIVSNIDADKLSATLTQNNQGFEGVTWYKDDVFFLGNQSNPTRVIKYSLSEGIISYWDIKNRNESSEIAELVYDNKNDCLWVLNSEQTKCQIFKYSLDGELLGQYDTNINAKDHNPEALAIDTENNIFWIGCDNTSKLFKVASPDYSFARTLSKGEILFNEYDTSNKFVELYNTTDEELDLTGCTVTKHNEEGIIESNNGDDFYAIYKFTVNSPNSSIIQPHGTLTLEYSKDNIIGPSCGLSGKKWWTLTLLDKNETIIDVVTNEYDSDNFENVPPIGICSTSKKTIITPGSYTVSRVYDGADLWKVGESTIGTTNGPDPRVPEDFVKINASGYVAKNGENINYEYTITSDYNIKSTSIISTEVTLKQTAFTMLQTSGTTYKITTSFEGLLIDNTYKLTISATDVKGHTVTKQVSLIVYTPAADALNVQATDDGILSFEQSQVNVTEDTLNILVDNGVTYDEESETLIILKDESSLSVIEDDDNLIFNEKQVLVDEDGIMTLLTDKGVSFDEETGTLIILK